VLRAIVFRLPVRVRNDTVPRVTFTDPELAQAGMTETQARAQYREIRILRWPFHENDRAQTERDTTGHIKVVTTAHGRILGATIVGTGAGEQIALWALALAQGLNVRAVANVVFPYPTRMEAGKRAAIDFFRPSLTRPWLRRIIGVLRGFG
jgi:pyruvate/2-oxoglutarate dehydrogenase complex dihydrolipoamide dehydrogenase (E3) component